MQYNQPYGVTDSDAPYINGNPSTGTMGSIPPAASIEYPQREIVHFEQDSGLAPSNSDLRQLSKAVQSGVVNYGPDLGTVNQVQITLTPPPTLQDGLIVRTLIAVSNTGDSTLNLNALGPKPIVRRGGTKLLAADLLGGSMAMFLYNKAKDYWELYGGTSTSAAGGQLHANLDIYVDINIGNDANDGTDATAAHALKTCQAAVNLAFNYAPSQYNITIHIAAGTYNGSNGTMHVPSYAGPALIVKGATAASVLLFSTDPIVTMSGPNTMTIQNVTTQTGGHVDNGGQHYFIGAGSTLTVSGCASNTSGDVQGGAVFQAYGGTIGVQGHTFNGGACCAAFWASANGSIGINGTISIAGAMQVGNAFVWASGGGAIAVGVAPYPTFPGAGNVIGTKYLASANGTIGTVGAGPNFFPGNSPGYVQTGGQYT